MKDMQKKGKIGREVICVQITASFYFDLSSDKKFCRFYLEGISLINFIFPSTEEQKLLFLKVFTDLTAVL